MSTCTSIGIRNILFPTDFSDESVQALKFVQRLQSHYNARVHVVHVLDMFPFSLGSDPASLTKTKEITSEGSRRLQAFMEAHGLKEMLFKPALMTGEASFAVEEFTKKHEIDLIMLGSRGDVGLTRLFEGSMAEEIFRTAQCPVFVVGPSAGAAEQAETFNRLFFPSDLSSFSRAAVPYVEFLLTENSAARVSLAHFLEHDPGTAYDRHKLRHDAEQELTNMFSPALRRQIQDVAVEFCSPADGMIGMARGFATDLLILGVRQGGSFTRAATHGLCSMTHQIVSQAPCPILTVRGS
jgi:nucleotide-binding universal stress UspA family protein